MRWFPSGCGLALVAIASAAGPFDGEWRTTIGLVKLEQDGDKVKGTYGNAGQFPLEGTVAGKVLTFSYQEGPAKGDARFTLDDSGNAFTGGFQIRGGRGGSWDGWRPDPEAPASPRGSFEGLWLTSFGLMELKPDDKNRLIGRYAQRGTSEIAGEIHGRRFEFHYQGFRGGKGWFDLAKDGKTLAGAAGTDGFPGWYGWRCRRAPEYVRHVKLEPGRILDGSTKSLLAYHVRAPESYAPGDAKRWPTVVLLHGSNMNGKSYVATFAAAWPDLAKRFIVLGIDGETPSDTGDEPRFNYSYVNYTGRSTYRGFPGTDRESPALVREALEELRDVYPIQQYFVGGHSQGGFLTYSLLMNSPELLAGAFPISCGVIFQCEPGAYDDAPLRKAQRAVPLAIVHAKNDPVVDFAMGQYAAGLFGDAGWPAFRFFADEAHGHMFARLPVGEAVHWLETLASDDAVVLLDFAERRLKEGSPRDAIAALRRVRTLPLGPPQKERRERLSQTIETRAKPDAQKYLEAIRKNVDGSWADGFLAYRDDFEFAECAAETMEAFARLRVEHEPAAKKAFNEARAAFQQGQKDEGYAKYKEIVEKEYASSLYRNAKRWLAERR
jgi:predicted esterase